MISLLVAAAENNVIGIRNALPWQLPNDLKYFKNVSWGMPVLMGRKTYEALGKALPGRKSIVITRNTNWKPDDATIVHTLQEGMHEALASGAKEIFVLGGAQVFAEAITSADRIYLTRIHHTFEGDAFFPEMDANRWVLVKNTFCKADAKNAFDHSFQIWERKKAG